MDTTSLWKAISRTSKQFPNLANEIETDVCIIGGGITGITAALQLINAGKKVVILEAYTVGSGTTGDSTGNLYIPIQPFFHKLTNNFELDTLKIVAQSRKNAIDYIEAIINELDFSCNFSRRPMYFYTNQEDQINFLKKEVETLKKCEIDIDYAQTLPIDLPHKMAALMENQARINPMQYVISIAEHIANKDCLIFENSRVTDISEEKNHCIFKTSSGSVRAKHGIIATHTPIGINPIQLCTAPYRSYVVAIKTTEENTYPEMNYWGLGNQKYTLSTHCSSSNRKKPDVILAAGSHHKTGQGDPLFHFKDIENYLRKILEVSEVEYRWSAQHYHSADGLPYIGLAKNYRKIYEATGYFADGLVYGTIAGIVISNRILNKNNELEKTYDSQRHHLGSSIGFIVKENFNIFLQYMKDMPKFSTKNYLKVKQGRAEVMDIKGEKCGVYHDENGKFHIVSAVCPHMKCIVNWNGAEKTWDCPCHGSRFASDGKYIEGPAMSNLKQKIELVNRVDRE